MRVLLCFLLSACMEMDMALPVSRNTTYAPGSQVLSDDMNDFQDAIIDLDAGHRTSSRHRMIPGASGASGPVTPGETWFSVAAHKHSSDNQPELLLIPVVVESGERITVTITLSYTGSVPAGPGNTVGLYREDAGTIGGAPTLVGTSQPIANSAGAQTITLVSNHDVVSQSVYGIQVNMGLITSSSFKDVYFADVLATRP